jgi:hypothetical protein
VNRPDLLESEDPAVVIEAHESVEWGDACRIARGFDAAVVVANINPDELPSKSIQYLTLPIPRVAVTAASDPGELGAFAARRPGFVAVDIDSRDDVLRLMTHVRRAWPGQELSPPAGDSWNVVARDVAGFAIEAWDRQRDPKPGSRAAPRARLPATNPRATINHK